MAGEFEFCVGIACGVMISMIIFGTLSGGFLSVSSELCSSIGEDFVKTISSNEVQCENTLSRIVPKEGANKEIKIISSDSIIGGE